MQNCFNKTILAYYYICIKYNYLLLNYCYFILIIHLPMYHPTYLTTNLSTIYILSKYLSSINLPIYDLSISIQHLINKQNLWLLHTIVVCCCELLNIKALLLRNKGALTNLQGKPNISKEANKTKLFYSKGLGRNPLSLIKELACPCLTYLHLYQK